MGLGYAGGTNAQEGGAPWRYLGALESDRF
jgi:hypothetical protein